MSGIRPLSEHVAIILGRYGHRRTKRFAVRLGPVVMPTKGAARDLIQAVKDDVPLEQVLPDEYTPVILAILDWHPGKAEKLQHGCRGFMVRHNPPYRPNDDRGFWIVTESPPPNDLVSFSYITCFDPSRDSADPLQKLAEAGRAAIGLSQWGFKSEWGFRHNLLGSDMACPRCGAPLTLDAAHVDHVEPKFRAIVAAFVDRYGQPPPHALVKRPTYGWQFTNPTDAALFAGFHDACALVREVVCAACNLAAERGQ